MRRVAEDQLTAWIQKKRRKPLIIRGARQVGKTWLVENYLAKQFTSYIKIDLEKSPLFHTAFEGDLSPQTILQALELHVGKRIIPEETLLFIDEIQACPRAIMALRYFYEELPELHVVAAGSMLEFALGEISIPVGRVQYMHLYPMTFYEFLLANGKDIMTEYLLNPSKLMQLSEVQTSIIYEELKNYFFVGGMPEAVSAYVATGSFIESSAVHTEIITSYKDDFSKYRPSVDHTILGAVLQKSAQIVGKQVIYTKLYEQASGLTNRKALDMLCQAKLIHKIHSANPSGLPLGVEGKRFKLAMVDIGLMQNLCGMQPTIQSKKESLLSLYKGQLAEQFVAQELLAWHKTDLFYWSRSAPSSNAEVDFLIRKDNHNYPIEVKSGSAGRLKSLHLFLQTYKNCREGWVLQDGSYRELPEQRLKFFPLYATPLLGHMRYKTPLSQN